MAGEVRVGRDHITWHQILVGYAFCGCILAAVAAVLVFDSVDRMKTIATIGVVAVVALGWLLEKPASRLHAVTLAARPMLDMRLKWLAVLFLCIVSLALTVAIVVLPPMGRF